MSKVGMAVKETGDTVIQILIYALVIGTIVGLSTFASLTILNVTSLTASLVTFFAGIVAMIGIVGTFIGIRWLVSVIKGKGKNDSISNITA